MAWCGVVWCGVAWSGLKFIRKIQLSWAVYGKLTAFFIPRVTGLAGKVELVKGRIHCDFTAKCTNLIETATVLLSFIGLFHQYDHHAHLLVAMYLFN